MYAPIQFTSPKSTFEQRKKDIHEAIERVLESGFYILGPEVETFEHEFAHYLGLARVTGCASGTDALELILRALGIGAGKAVFTVSHTAVATVAAIERAGAVPVLVDIDPASMTMCPDSLERAVRHIEKSEPGVVPAAVIAVHLYGHPCAVDSLCAIAEVHNLAMIEDCAQAHGARYKNRMVGSMGRAAAFSFYPTKNLGALGDGGACACNDSDLDDRIKSLRQYGWKDRYISAVSGINSRLDPLQAAILGVQLRCLDEDNAARIRLAGIYAAGLPAGIIIPEVAKNVLHVYHLYVIRIRKRDELMAYLRKQGIGVAVHYPLPVHLQPAYTGCLTTPGGLPVTEAVAGEILSLPMYARLAAADVEHVCEAIAKFMRGAGACEL
jgi:dTDP-4-amino-4,6-dideoxygalactose transaminase